MRTQIIKCPSCGRLFHLHRLNFAQKCEACVKGVHPNATRDGAALIKAIGAAALKERSLKALGVI